MKYFKLIIMCLLVLVAMLSCTDGEPQSNTGVIIDGDSTQNTVNGIIPNVTSNVSSCLVNYTNKGNGNIEVVAIEDEGHIFTGWYLDDVLLISKKPLDIVNLKTTAYGDYVKNGTLTITARFAEAVSVSFDLDGGTATDIKTKYDTSTDGATLPSDEVSKFGYTLVGWRDDEGNILSSIPEGTKGSIHLTAVWVKKIDESIVNTVLSVDVDVTSMESFAPMGDIISSLVIHFTEGKCVKVYSNIGGSYVDVGNLYTQYIHNLDRLSEIRYRESDSSKEALYNIWDHTAPRYDNGISFRYEISGTDIFIYLESYDDRYNGYIEKYFSWPIYTLQYDGENMHFLPYKYPYEDSLLENAFEMYLNLFEGGKPQSTQNHISYSEQKHLCKNISTEWNEMYSECVMDIEQIGNKVLVQQDGTVSYISNSNFLSPNLREKNENDKKIYKLDSVTSIRDHICASPFIVNTDNGYRVYFFSALNGCVFELALKLNSEEKLHLYYFSDSPTEAQIVFVDESTGERIAPMYVFENVYSTKSDWANDNYWGFNDYNLSND